MTITVGEIGTASVIVTEKDTARGLLGAHETALPGDAYADVLATTKMIALMELAAGRILQQIQTPEQLSVGVGLNIRHLAASPIGMEVTATATYIGQEGKLYKFKVEAFDRKGKVGEGEHTRAIIEAERLLSAAAKRNEPG